jgi:hypothetical protein
VRPLTVRCAWVALVGVLAVVLVGVTAFLVGEARAPEHMVVRELGAQRLSAMMRGDAFFTEYRDAAVIVAGEVAAASGGRFRFTTYGGGGQVWCDLAEGVPTPAVGELLTVVTIAAQGERLGEEHDLLLAGCTPVTPR